MPLMKSGNLLELSLVIKFFYFYKEIKYSYLIKLNVSRKS